jgi:phospholipid transport system substrate-binding protein
MRRLLVLFLLMVSVAAWSAEHPQVLVENTTDEIFAALKRERDVIAERPARLYEIVDEIVLPHMDFIRMSSWVLGKYWRQASEAEREQFTREFRDLLVRTYAKAVNEKERIIETLPMRGKLESGDVTVRTEVQEASGFPIPIDYQMYLKDDAWKVYDVSVDGISLIANYRTTFASEIRRDGLPKFIANLAARNREAVNEQLQ